MEITKALQPSAQLEQFLTFLIAGEEYAVSILKVKEIVEYDTVTKVPQTPNWVSGVFNLRGSVVPVIDLAAKFGLAPAQLSKTTCVVMVEVALDGDPLMLGILVDAVSQVVDLAPEDIGEVPSFGTAVHLDYLLGMVTMGRRFAMLLDIDTVLSASDLLEMKSTESSAVEQQDPANKTASEFEPAIQ